MKQKQMFSWNSLAFSITQWRLAILSLAPLPFLSPAWTSGSSWFAWCWSLSCKILSVTLLAWEMSATVQRLAHSLVLPFLGTGMRIDLFQSCDHCCVFQICWHNECKTLMASSFRDLNSSAGISLHPLPLLKAVLSKRKKNLRPGCLLLGGGEWARSLSCKLPLLPGRGWDWRGKGDRSPLCADQKIPKTS